MKEDGKTIIYLGYSKEHILGVDICLSSLVAKSLIGSKTVNESIIMKTNFQTRHAKIAITLQNVMDEIPRQDIKLLVGDFNLQTDKYRQGIESNICPYKSANITNDSGERFTLFCSLNDISIGKNFFKHKDIPKTT